MRALILASTVPPILAFLIGLLQPAILFGSNEIDASFIWSIVGVLVSYAGLVISSSALFEVSRLTNRFFARQRLPEIQKQLEKITKAMLGSSNRELKEIRSERFVGETAVMIRQIKAVKIAGISPLIKRAEQSHANLELEMKRLDPAKSVANESNSYWDLFRCLTELADEIEEYKKGAQANL